MDRQVTKVWLSWKSNSSKRNLQLETRKEILINEISFTTNSKKILRNFNSVQG